MQRWYRRGLAVALVAAALLIAAATQQQAAGGDARAARWAAAADRWPLAREARAAAAKALSLPQLAAESGHLDELQQAGDIDALFTWLAGLVADWNRTGLVTANCSHPALAAGAAGGSPAGELEPLVLLPYPWHCKELCTVAMRGAAGRRSTAVVDCAEWRAAGRRERRALWRAAPPRRPDVDNCRGGRDDRWRRDPQASGRTTPGREALHAAQRVAQQLCRRGVGAAAPPAARRVLVDLGARSPPSGGAALDWATGAVEELRRAGVQLAARPLPPSFGYPEGFDEVHAFEMSPWYAALWDPHRRAGRLGRARLHFHHAAVGATDGEVRFALGADAGAMENTASVNCSAVQCAAVPQVDIARWLPTAVRRSDWVVLKMDIEGSEWQLLPRLLGSGVLFQLVDELFVELHDMDGFPYLKALRRPAGAAGAPCENRRCSLAALWALRDAGLAARDWG